MEGKWSKREAWCLGFHTEETRGNQTNNYSEISVCLLKDEGLNRFKAYNVISLVESICNDMTSYYIRRLNNFANSRDNRARLQWEKEEKNDTYLQHEDIVSVGDNLFLVPSETDRDHSYTVDPSCGFCSCSTGRLGSYCKHMAGVSRYNKHAFVLNLPPITLESHYQMAFLAFGEDAGDISLYYPLVIHTDSS